MAQSSRRSSVFGIAVFILALGLILALGASAAHIANIGSQVADRAASARDRAKSIKGKSRYVKELAQMKREFTYTYVEIPSQQFDHTITAATITAADSPKGVVVMVHGLGGAKETILNPARVFLEMGFDVLTIDERRSGGNTAVANGSGVLESYDVTDALAYARTHLHSGGPLLLWGESYGAAASAIAVGRGAEQVDGLILDCPVSDARYLMRTWLDDKAAETQLSTAQLLFAGDLVNRVRYRFSLDDADVTGWVAETNVPTLIYVSEADTITPAWMGQDIYDAIPHSNKMLVASQTSPHVRIREKEPKLYREALEAFIPMVSSANRSQLADKP